MPREGTLRTYRCPPDHKHHLTGTCYGHGCGCGPCVAANTERARSDRKLRAYGRHKEGRIDKTAAANHVRALRELGWSIDAIASSAGVGHCVVDELLGDRYKRVLRLSAEAILALPLSGPPTQLWGRVSPTGSTRRLQALMCMGWSFGTLEKRFGFGVGFLSAVTKAELITSETRDRISALYDEIWDVAPPQTNSIERGSYTRARKLATERGYVSPLGWDDDSLDDEAATPAVTEPDREIVDDMRVDRALRGEKVTLNAAEKRAAVLIAHRWRWSDELTAERLHIADRTVLRIRQELNLEAWPLHELINRTDKAA